MILSAQVCDSSGDGIATKAELLALIATEKAFSDNIAKLFFSVLDADNSGVIDKDEMLGYVLKIIQVA